MLLFRAAPAARGRDCSGSAGAPATKTGLLADVLSACPGVDVHLGRFALLRLHDLAPLLRDFQQVEPELLVVGTGEGGNEAKGGGHPPTLADAWRSRP